jgi:hypothetical protein
MLKTLSRLFTLKPYSNQLIDGTAEIWLLLAALNIVSIAFCDALAWGYFGYTTAQGAWAYVAAGIAGLIVFVLVGSLDAMFVMHDRAREPRNAERKRWRIHRDHVAIGARIVLVILTFTVTAPFLTQLFFARDIEANIQRLNEQRVAARRGQIAAQLSSRQRDLEKEIAGTGASGRYGRGPTAAAIQRDVDALEQELRAFDAATPETLASRYGIDLVREGPDTRARVIAAMERSPSFRATQWTIKAFLLFMFLGLVALKLFQPESVRIYYSARLQAAFARLQAGIFNNRIDSRDPMTPIRFAEWYESDEAARELTERLRTQEDAIRVLHETLRLDIARIHDELSAVARTSDELEQEMVARQHELNVLHARIAEQQQAIDDFRYDFGDDLSLRDQHLLLSTRNRTARQLAEHRAAAAALTAALSSISQRLEASRRYESQLRQAFESASAESAGLADALQKARQRRVADVLGA